MTVKDKILSLSNLTGCHTMLDHLCSITTGGGGIIKRVFGTYPVKYKPSPRSLVMYKASPKIDVKYKASEKSKVVYKAPPKIKIKYIPPEGIKTKLQ